MSNLASYKLIEILQMSTDYLTKKGIENARLNAELLVGHVLKLSRVQLYLNFEKPVTAEELEQIRNLLKRRSNHEPLQYILEEAEFYSLKLKVNRSTLIPRPETEILVDTVIEQCKKNFAQEKTIEILDIGTGSGNIAIAVAKNFANSRITAIDIQHEALTIARQNAEYHQLQDRINFIQQDIFDIKLSFPEKFDVIVSNPPYISREEFDSLHDDIKNFEPYIALDGGSDGLAFYHRLTNLAPSYLAQDGFIAVEFGANQPDQIKKIFANSAFFQYIEIITDLNKLPRILLARKE
ncbi:MAG: peptide chain release factor N(5)-glutamine methyltransferase [bacterium]|jgi:release factor glutamine methyltransferase|nr:peptide chain release factor N(5)-glutamine methyltransferase [bacterium]